MASRKENALDLAKFIDKGVRVKLSGGREGDRTATRTPCPRLLNPPPPPPPRNMTSRCAPHCSALVLVSGHPKATVIVSMQWRAS